MDWKQGKVDLKLPEFIGGYPLLGKLDTAGWRAPGEAIFMGVLRSLQRSAALKGFVLGWAGLDQFNDLFPGVAPIEHRHKGGWCIFQTLGDVFDKADLALGHHRANFF